jgi:hypothetical protein
MEQAEVSFLNSDHVISVTIHQGESAVTTTAGPEIKIPASPATISRFADPPSYCYGATSELAKDVQSNFVWIAAGTDTVRSVSHNSCYIFSYKLFLNPDSPFGLPRDSRLTISHFVAGHRPNSSKTVVLPSLERSIYE